MTAYVVPARISNSGYAVILGGKNADRLDVPVDDRTVILLGFHHRKKERIVSGNASHRCGNAYHRSIEPRVVCNLFQIDTEKINTRDIRRGKFSGYS